MQTNLSTPTFGDTRLPPRFWAKIRVRENGCWEWAGGIRQDGYAIFHLNWRRWYAHRLTYETLIDTIPLGLQCDHLCRNRACVNPAHIEPVTQRENVRRGLLALPREFCNYGHPYSGPNLYVAPNGTRHCRACRRRVDRELYWRNPEAGREKTRRRNQLRRSDVLCIL